MKDKTVYINVSNRTVLRVIGLIIASVLIVKFIDRVLHPLTLIFVSFFLALALNPIVSWLTTKLPSGSRVRATAVAYISVVFILIGFFSLVIPPIFNQTRDFIQDAPLTAESFSNQDSDIAEFARRYKLNEQLDKVAENISNSYDSWAGQAFNTGKRVGGAFVSVIVVFVLTFMMLVEGPVWLNKIWDMMPPKRRVRQKQTATKMYRAVTAFVNGQVLIAAFGGVMATIAIWIASTIMGVSVNAVALGGIVALFALIPLIGNVISAIIVVLVCLLSSVGLAVIMLAYFLVYQQIENATVQPYVQSRQNELSPLIVFMAALIGVGFAGLIGAFVAIPTASSLKILFDDYVRDRLAEHNKKAKESDL